jgi:hypothetical protein
MKHFRFSANARISRRAHIPILLTENQGQIPRGEGRSARFVSVAGGRFDRKIEWFEGLCPVVDAPFATLATSSTGGGAALASG